MCGSMLLRYLGTALMTITTARLMTCAVGISSLPRMILSITLATAPRWRAPALPLAITASASVALPGTVGYWLLRGSTMLGLAAIRLWGQPSFMRGTMGQMSLMHLGEGRAVRRRLRTQSNTPPAWAWSL